jgi:predicted transcriptional regulator
MPRRPSSQPTEAELEILNVLWHREPSTVREVHECLQADRETSLNTTLKLLQIMVDKGVAVRDDHIRPHRYSAAKSKENTQAGLLQDLARRAFCGSVRKLLIRAVEDGDLSSEELAEVRALIDSVRKGQRKKS